MFTSVDAFLKDWVEESSKTARLLDALTDASLAQRVGPEDRTLGRIAWHIVTTLPELMGRVGIEVSSVSEGAPVPGKAAEISKAYKTAAQELASHIERSWKDETLQAEDNMYGHTWRRGQTLEVLVRHQIHHRGQMTVLMRQAGLVVPGIYGMAREEWAKMGMSAPEV